MVANSTTAPAGRWDGSFPYGPTAHGPWGFFSFMVADAYNLPVESRIALLVLEIIVMCLGGVLFADVVSGIVHLMLDYEVGSNDVLRLHVEHSIPAVIAFEQNSDIFIKAKPRDKYLWNFHSHHDAPYPSADSKLTLVKQIVFPMTPPLAGFTVAALFGVMPAWLCIILATGFALGPISQFTHFLAHARTRGLVKSKVLMFMQDWHIILHPAVHRSHHIHFDREFCILNGWGNPIVNRLRRFGSYLGYFPKVAPTVTTRLEREKANPNGASAPEDEEGKYFAMTEAAVSSSTAGLATKPAMDAATVATEEEDSDSVTTANEAV